MTARGITYMTANITGGYVFKNNFHKFRFIIIFISTAFLFNGCLFTRPFTPSARLVQPGSLYTEYSYGVCQYNSIYDDHEGYTSKDTTTSRIMDIGFRMRLPWAASEAGITMSDYLNYSIDYKYAFTDPEKDTFLRAVDLALYMNSTNSIRIGGAAGFNLNIVINRDLPFDLAAAAYYQYMDYSSGGSDNSAYSFGYGASPFPHSIYLYGGIETGVFKGIETSLGVGYILFLNSPMNTTVDCNYNPVLVIASCKYSLTKEQPKKNDTINPVTNDVNVGFYISTADKFIKTNDYKDASDILLAGLDRYPDDYNLNRIMGLCCRKLGNDSLAYYYYKKALASNPDDEDLIRTTNALKGNK
jgi:tetratricopeptide (TPR) repeat protein